MKTVSKLMTISALLLIGALVSFGADVKKPAPSTPAAATKKAEVKAKFGESDYKDIIGSMTVEEFVNKLESKERFNHFAKMVEDKNPEMAEKIKKYVEDNKGKRLKTLDKEKLRETFEGVVPGLKKTKTNDSKKANMKKNDSKKDAKANKPAAKTNPKTNAKSDKKTNAKTSSTK